jgi:hypothetical protein
MKPQLTTQPQSSKLRAMLNGNIPAKGILLSSTLMFVLLFLFPSCSENSSLSSITSSIKNSVASGVEAIGGSARGVPAIGLAQSPVQRAGAIATPGAAKQSLEASTSGTSDIYIGMTRIELLNLYPGAKETTASTIELHDAAYDVPGVWTFSFRDEKLSWFVFNGYNTEINPDSFTQSLKTARTLIDTYTAILGLPGQLSKGIEVFKDPTVQRHQGYKVISAQWDTPKGKIVVDFSFLGEGNDYSFLVTLQASA